MHILIDAYNLFKQIVQERQVSAQQRTLLIKRLTTYARKKGHTITLVFDGQEDLDQREYREKGMAIVYSGYRETADDVIKRRIDRREQGGFLLVTSDRELVSYAQLAGVDTMPSLEFYRLVVQALEPVKVSRAPEHVEPLLIKTTDATLAEVDDLMRSIGAPPAKDETSGRPQRSTITLSKKEKEHLRKLKKL